MAEQTSAANRNFNTISPSARWILLMKGHTDIPFAREAAELIEYPQKFTPDFDNRDKGFWGRTLHFENRYRSIDQLLSGLAITNIIELSSGFSFRGLDLAQQKEVHYIDTDLPELITQKREFIKELRTGITKAKGRCESVPLNALDGNTFTAIVNDLPPGEVVVVNEGLLVYLNRKEKEQLCRIIYQVLKDRGGYWITGDIYLTLASRNVDLALDEETKKFFEEQRVEENRFESFEAAEAFFRRMGFVIDQEANIDPTILSSFPHLIKDIPPDDLRKMSEAEKIHATWRLRLAEI